MNLNQLFTDAPTLKIDSLMVDSREKSKRALFFCLKGMVHDGHLFTQEAIEHGAVAIVHSDDLSFYKQGITYIRVDNVLSTLNIIASRFYENPSNELKVFGVTGTNGKSTIATLIKHFYQDVANCGYIGTIAIEYNDVKEIPLLTTPDIVPLHHILRKMVDSNVKAVALEVSSHGLEQNRVDSIDFDVAVFTNLTHDHLDFHGYMENYFQAKKKLFTMLKPTGIAVVNVDDSYGERIINDYKGNLVTYGINKRADFMASDIQLFADKTIFKLYIRSMADFFVVETNLVALFNVYNLLAVIAAVMTNGGSIEKIIEQAKQIPQVDGRMEVIKRGQGFNCIVDYAHTPDGFIKLFTYAQSITQSNHRIIVVFGSAGQRDSKKRPILGEIADKYCDMIIITEEDPRNEKVSDICASISSGIQSTNYIIIENRYDAIRQACEIACTKDTVLILGKGDENYMYREFGREVWPGDQVVTTEIIDELMEQSLLCTLEELENN